MVNKYTAKSIEVLEGLEPVRRRPGMYIGGTDIAGLHHLVWEALDNAVDEAINGHCDKISIIIGKKGTVTVEDNGRGIPVDKHPKFKKPALEIIMTTLHAGAKFSQKSYSTSGGLHGVGISVVCALSDKMQVIVKRDKNEWTQHYSQGKPVSKLKKVKPARGHGTKIIFSPDPEIFKKTVFSKRMIMERAETEAFLNSGVTIDVHDDRDGTKETFHYSNGIRDYLSKLLLNKTTVGSGMFYSVTEDKMKVEVALQWTTSPESRIYSFANSVSTSDGGAHENGLRLALTKSIRGYIERSNGKSKNGSITGEDVKEGMTAVLSVFLANPQFQGQTKEKLNNMEAHTAVEQAVKAAFDRYLLENPTTADEIVGRVKLAAQARLASRAAKDNVLRKTAISHRLTLPGKLADCSSTDPATTELFIVEGDSAGGSSKQARNRTTQAVLPLRGKILNVENATVEKLVNNKELEALTISIGAGMGGSFNYSKLRYAKIIIMTDADVDGAHISALMLTFFYRYMPQLIENGNVYLAQPPLFKIELGKKTLYAQDDEAKEKILNEAPKNVKPVLSRYKGLGEMPAKILKETTMDPAGRTLLRVTVENELTTDTAFTRLMGKDASARLEFLQNNSAAFVSAGGELDV